MDCTGSPPCAKGAWRRAPRAEPRGAAALALLACLAAACDDPGTVPAAPGPGPQRLLEAPPGASTAALPRAQIAGESRYVLAAHPALVLRSREEVTLPTEGALRVAVPLPAELAGEDVRLDAWASARDPKAPAESIADLREGGRLMLAAAPRVVAGGGDGPPALELPVPAGLGGAAALLTVVARPLPPRRWQHETKALAVPSGARLDFGYGVEEPGWAAGWPPVRFAVSALADGGEPLPLFERRIDPAADARDRRWFDASVDLSPLAGRRVRLRFDTEALGDAPGASVGRSFAVVSSPVVAAAPTAAARNVVLVSLDTLRARSVSAYGNPHRTTPSLDTRLAAAGARMAAAVSPFPFTPPAHMTMLTGLEPCAHGVKDLHTRLGAERTTLAEWLRAAGYATAAFTEDAYLVAGNGFDRGFDVYHENRGEESPAPGFAAETFGAAARWLETQAREPFFLFVHTYQVHEPYVPPRGYAGLFAAGTAPEPNRRALAGYEGEARYLDDVLADFLDLLDARGLAAHTVVVVTSDHGESFGEHFWTGHGFDLHDEALLVPLVVRAPGLVPPGRVVEEQVTLADIAPTVTELVGLAPPAGIQGQSFARLLTGRGAAFAERPAVLMTLSGQEGVRTRRYKYIAHPKASFFYDLAADPLEARNLIAEEPPDLKAAQALLATARAACAAGAPAAPAAAPDATPDAQPGWMVNRDEIERKLKSLGYVQ